MVPLGRRNLLTTGPGPDDGCSRLSVFRPQMPEKFGIAVGSSAITGETNITNETDPAAWR
jgi:hypothetical protein